MRCNGQVVATDVAEVVYHTVVATDVAEVVYNLRDMLGHDNVVWWDAPQDDGTGREDPAAGEHESLAPERGREDPAAGEHESLAHALKRAVDHWTLS
ncbi:hypothetical protein T484DRAFT_1839077, partial [Baffinella frigidus]